MTGTIQTTKRNVDQKPISMLLPFSTKARNTHRDGVGRTVKEPSIKMMAWKSFSL